MAKAEELTGIKKSLFYWAVSLGEIWEPYGQNGAWYEFKLKIASKLIFSKWRAALGGELHTMVSGSAALQPRLTRIFSAAGMQIMEGYGLTETSPVVTVGKYNDNMFRVGTVGTPIDNVEVKIAEDGEILIKGPNVMLGYFKDPEKTASVMTGDYLVLMMLLQTQTLFMQESKEKWINAMKNLGSGSKSKSLKLHLRFGLLILDTSHQL